MLNGLSIAPMMHKLFALPPETRFGELAHRLRLRLLIALSISQACWWTAALIGWSTARSAAGPEPDRGLVSARAARSFWARGLSVRSRNPLPLSALGLKCPFAPVSVEQPRHAQGGKDSERHEWQPRRSWPPVVPVGKVQQPAQQRVSSQH